VQNPDQCKAIVTVQRSYAFVDYDDDKSAEDAIKNLNGKDMGGLKIAVEWSKKSRNFDERQAANRPFARENRKDERCYKCDK
jgi:RNA recognition motif-containing protein